MIVKIKTPLDSPCLYDHITVEFDSIEKSKPFKFRHFVYLVSEVTTVTSLTSDLW